MRIRGVVGFPFVHIFASVALNPLLYHIGRLTHLRLRKSLGMVSPNLLPCWTSSRAYPILHLSCPRCWCTLFLLSRLQSTPGKTVGECKSDARTTHSRAVVPSYAMMNISPSLFSSYFGFMCELFPPTSPPCSASHLFE